MYAKLFTTAAVAATVVAQNSSMSLTDLLGATSDLSTLTSAVMGVPGLAEMLGSASNVTILAPSNDAFDKLHTSGASNDSLAMQVSCSLHRLGALADRTIFQALLMYHILNGTYPASAVMDIPAFLPTMLNDSMYTNVTGGQIVEAVRQGDRVIFYSELLSNATVTTAVCTQSIGQSILTDVDRTGSKFHWGRCPHY